METGAGLGSDMVGVGIGGSLEEVGAGALAGVSLTFFE